MIPSDADADADAAPSDDATASHSRADAGDGGTPPTPDDSARRRSVAEPGTLASEPASAPPVPEQTPGAPAFASPASDPLDRTDDTTALSAVTPAHSGPDTAVIGWVSRPTRRHRVAGWALGLAIIALVASLFGAWGLPVGIAAVVVALRAVRGRAARAVAVWALALAVLSVLYGAGWLIWMLGQR